MITLKEIQLTNFLSHSKTTIEFEQNQKMLIDGKSGSGKSSIVEGLVWGWYGKGRSDNKSLIKKGSLSAKVVIVVYDDEKNIYYKTERSINNKNKHEFKVFEGKDTKKMTPIKESGIKVIQDFWENKVLKSSYLLFINSIVYLQENSESFVKQPANKRKDIILEIINASDYDNYLKLSKEEIQKRKSSHSILLAKIEDRLRTIETNKKTASEIENYKASEKLLDKELAIIEEKIKNDNEVLSKIMVEKSLMERDRIELFEISEQIKVKEKKIEELNAKIIKISSKDFSQLEVIWREINDNKIMLDHLEKKSNEFNEWNNKVNELMRGAPIDKDYQKDIDDLNKQMIGLLSSRIDNCPELNKPCPLIQKNQDERVKQLEENLSDKIRLKNNYENEKMKYSYEIEKLGKVDSVNILEIIGLRQKIAEYEKQEKVLADLKTEKEFLNNYVTELNYVDTEIKELLIKKDTKNKKIKDNTEIEKEEHEIKLKLDDSQLKLRRINAEKNENTGRILIAEEALKSIEKIKDEIKDSENELNVEKENLENLELVKDAFGPNGIRAIVIDYIIPQLEDRINNILGRLSDFTIKLETQKSGLGKDTILEGLFITIVNGQGDEIDFSNYSGGEKLKIIVAISEALSEIQKVGFRILDELFIGLDDESIEGFTGVMLELQERFSQMICISHLRNIKDIFESKITISKINGTSKVII